MLDAIRCLVDNGLKWRAMPADFPPWDLIYAFYRRRRDRALVKEFYGRLRASFSTPERLIAALSSPRPRVRSSSRCWPRPMSPALVLR
ncbi:transposase [Streptomyces sp. NPDC091280]|uniref:transposase n=1 Tax=Streptomyces sp. NPDC091280 TaxID=3365984 RepID=UPI0037FDE320